MSYLSFRLVDDAISTPNLNDLTEDSVEDPPDIPKAVRIDLAHQAWKDANGQLAIKKAARTFDVGYSTLRDRIK